MKQTNQEMLSQLQGLSDKLTEHRHEILKLPTRDFIRSFVELTTTIEQLDALREVMLGRAEKLLSRPEETERKMRREHLKLVHSRK